MEVGSKLVFAGSGCRQGDMLEEKPPHTQTESRLECQVGLMWLANL